MATTLTQLSPTNTTAISTRIVGIGASAGGLAPLEAFLGNIPPHTGLAYVVVQHLDPKHKAMLSEILQRATVMPVFEAEQNMPIKPDSVYVIRPDTELSVVNGTLHLATPVEPRGMRLPINVLFSSLASTQGERAIAVVLSGMGSDGTLGMQAIKAVGGLNAVQLPDTAQFNSMPNSAITAECADIIAPAAELPAQILAYVAKVPDPAIPARKQAEQLLDSEPLDRVFNLLQERTRHDFSMYKSSTLHRRIERRMAIHKINTLPRYTQFMQENPQETDLLFNELLIGVTSFFRDKTPWEYLAKTALPDLLARPNPERHLRAWVVGCSTGEEAYSLAIIFSEVIRKQKKFNDFTLQVFATDLSADAIQTARRGCYPVSIRDRVSATRLASFFIAHDDSYEISPEIRDMVLFAQQDVVLDPPFTRLDIISCRNLLIYFDATLQRRLIPLFHYSLRDDGLLLLGSAETVGRFTNLFNSLESNLRLYQRQGNVARGGLGFMMQSFPPLSHLIMESAVPTTDHPFNDNLQAAADEVLLQVFAPAAVLVNSDGDILYISGRTGKYLEPAAGKANWNIHVMLREGLRGPINVAMKKSTSDDLPHLLHNLQVQMPGGEQHVDITIQTLREPPALRAMTMIVFRDIVQAPASTRKGKNRAVTETVYDSKLQQYRDEIHTLREEARTSREELQSTNEVMQSTNEELQSTNEELTTSKEEMQSMNEELQTINSEMQSKLDELVLAQSDMSNLLNSTDIAILFLDHELNVRRYTDRLTKIVNIRLSDVERPFSDLTNNLEYPTLQEDALETLRSLSFSEKQVQAADGRWFSVRIMPYRRLDNVIDGVVITFMDITETKKLEQALRDDLKSNSK